MLHPIMRSKILLDKKILSLSGREAGLGGMSSRDAHSQEIDDGRVQNRTRDRTQLRQGIIFIFVLCLLIVVSE